MKRRMLWAVKNGNEDWQEEIITTRGYKIEHAKEWARKNGFGRFRVAEYEDGERPNFLQTINH